MRVLLFFILALINEIHSKNSKFIGISYADILDNVRFNNIFCEFYFRLDFHSKKLKSFSMTYGLIFNYKEYHDIFFRTGIFGKDVLYLKFEFGISLSREINISLNLCFENFQRIMYGINISYISKRYKGFAIDIGISFFDTVEFKNAATNSPVTAISMRTIIREEKKKRQCIEYEEDDSIEDIMMREFIDRTTIMIYEERRRVLRIIGNLILRRILSAMNIRIIQIEKIIINRGRNLNHRNITRRRNGRA